MRASSALHCDTPCSPRMPIHTTPIDFPIQDATTLRFVGHCTQHWNNFALCSDAHVAFMKHLACYIFNLPAATQLIGILFEVFLLSFLLFNGFRFRGP